VTVQLKDSKKGEVKWTMAARGRFKFNSNFADFPFDFCDLRISLRSHKHSLSSMVLTHWVDVKGSGPDASYDLKACAAVEARSCTTDQWEVVGHRTEVYHTDPKASSTKKSYAELSVVVMIRRHSHWYLFNVFVVMFSLVIMSAAVMTIPPAEVGGRLEILMGTYFCVIAVKFSLGDQLPKLPYNTIADWYILSVYIFIFFVVVESLVVGVINTRKICDDFEDGCLLSVHIDNTFFPMHGLCNLLFHLLLYRKVRQCRRATDFWKTSALEQLSVQGSISDRTDFIKEVNGEAIRSNNMPTAIEHAYSFRIPESSASRSSLARKSSTRSSVGSSVSGRLTSATAAAASSDNDDKPPPSPAPPDDTEQDEVLNETTEMKRQPSEILQAPQQMRREEMI